MNKYCVNVVLLLISMPLLVASCSEKPLVEDAPDWWTFSVENLLDENVSISGSVNGNQFSITISPNESYTYTHDTMSGYIENGKTPIFLATSIKLVGATVGIVEYQTESFHKKWIEETEHHLVFKITSSLFQTDKP